MIDVIHQINAVQRQVGSRVLAAGEARTVTISQRYQASIEDLWDACTDAERIARWFLPVSGELRPGGRFQIEGNASGTVQQCDPPKGFSATWEYGGDTTWIEVRLEAESEEWTRLELEHIAHIDDERWAQFGPGAVGIGWDMGFMGLARHLSSGRAVDREQSGAWVTSPEGVQFMTLSSQSWRDASVAAGTSEDQARAAADRVTAAYTGGGQ
ncbi:MAG TPA: SRPBCC family protein [Streptosporangiaceae bacterium]